MNTPSNFQHVNNQDVSIYGKHSTVRCVNPFNCRFVLEYPDGRIVYGKDLIDTGWANVRNGFSKLTYILSTGHVIEIPNVFRAYKPTIEVSIGTDGSRVFHAINVNCLDENRVVIYKINLKEDNTSKLKIGDIVVTETNKPVNMDKSWKYT